MSDQVKIKNWDEKEYTLDELLQLVDAAKELECSFDQIMGGDLATSETIISGLIAELKKRGVE